MKEAPANKWIDWMFSFICNQILLVCWLKRCTRKGYYLHLDKPNWRKKDSLGTVNIAEEKFHQNSFYILWNYLKFKSRVRSSFSFATPCVLLANHQGCHPERIKYQSFRYYLQKDKIAIIKIFIGTCVSTRLVSLCRIERHLNRTEVNHEKMEGWE